MTITSSAFQHNEKIPSKYTCEGENINPPLTFSEVPREAKSLVLIVEDPDAPTGLFTHWMLYDMSPATLQILEHEVPETGSQGRNDFSAVGYGGPCPPNGRHRYFFRLYALNEELNLDEGATRSALDDAMQGKVMDTAEIMGFYTKTT